MLLVIFVLVSVTFDPALSFCPEEIIVGDSACSQVRQSASLTLIPVRSRVRNRMPFLWWVRSSLLVEEFFSEVVMEPMMGFKS